MLALCTVTALLFSGVFGATSVLLSADDPFVLKAKQVISKANNYITDHSLTSISLPALNIPFNPLSLSEGKLSQFNTIQLAGDPVIYQRPNADGTSTYTFDLELALNVIVMEYQFKISLFGPFSQNGQVTINPQKNTLRAKGVIVVGPNCDASITGADVTKFEDFQIDVEPDDIPYASSISETILNIVSPHLLPMTNLAIKGILFVPSFQENFSEFICKNIN